jgi:Ca2+/H+ antiporter, TMEM165/GDT1 family
LTIVLAVGVTRGWRPALAGVGAALAVLAGLVVALGPTLVHLVPLSALRVVIGTLLLVFGLQWLRKAILRAAGLKAKHDENAIFDQKVAELSEAPPSGGWDAAGFAVSFKGVFLEGLEVVVIVVTLGSTSHQLGMASLAAAAAVLVVGAVGVVVARQLAAVPENAMKMAVGLMLVSFGTFWAGEGVGVHWPGSELAIPVLVGVYGAVAWVSVSGLAHVGALFRRHPHQPAEELSGG